MAKAELLRRYLRVRGFSKKICETLEPEDCVIQTMPEASPTKWHLAHTSWFFEVFVLKQFFPDYQSLHPQYGFLFNSYYNAVGPFYSRLQEVCYPGRRSRKCFTIVLTSICWFRN